MKATGELPATIISLILLVSLASGVAGAQEGGKTAQDCSELKQRLSYAESRLKDWPQLGRYEDANARLPAPATGESRVVFMGDSITDIWKLEESFPGKPYVNRGIG